MDLDEKISTVAAQLKAVAAVEKKKPMYLSVDEWSPRPRSGHLSTLIIAEFFNDFIRHADTVKMANFTILTAILNRDPKSGATYKSPIFYAFKLFSTHCRGEALDTFVDCDTFGTSEYYTRIPYLDVSSVYDPQAKQVVINVVNRHKTDAIAADIQSVAGNFAGNATVSLINSDDLSNASYTYEARDSYPPKVGQVPASGATLHHVFPAHSFTQLVIGVDRP